MARCLSFYVQLVSRSWFPSLLQLREAGSSTSRVKQASVFVKLTCATVVYAANPSAWPTLTSILSSHSFYLLYYSQTTPFTFCFESHFLAGPGHKAERLRCRRVRFPRPMWHHWKQDKLSNPSAQDEAAGIQSVVPSASRPSSYRLCLRSRSRTRHERLMGRSYPPALISSHLTLLTTSILLHRTNFRQTADVAFHNL